MDVAGVGPTDILAHLPDCFEIGQTFDVADGPADLADDHIHVFATQLPDAGLDLVGDMRNHLDGGAQVVPAPFLSDNRLIDGTGGDI